MNQASNKVIFIIVTRNSKRFMPSCLESILNQTNRDFQVAVIDNNSADGTASFVRSNYPMVSVIENNKNTGFAKANNQGIRLFKAPYVILCNPDIVLTPDWLEKMLAAAEAEENRGYGVFGGRLLKLKMLNLETGDMEKTEVVDSCGLKLLKNHRFVELGAGEDQSNWTTDQQVFGHSGALVMFRRTALEEVAIRDKFHQLGDYLDGSFFFYKEDVDLAWRLNVLGFKSLLVAGATAYHLRTFSLSETIKTSEVISNRRQQNYLAKYYSYRNHLLLLLENSFFSNLFLYSPQIFWLELKKLIYVIFFEPRNLLAWVEVIKMVPEIRIKRQQLMAQAKILPRDFREWLG